MNCGGPSGVDVNPRLGWTGVDVNVEGHLVAKRVRFTDRRDNAAPLTELHLHSSGTTCTDALPPPATGIGYRLVLVLAMFTTKLCCHTYRLPTGNLSL